MDCADLIWCILRVAIYNIQQYKLEIKRFVGYLLCANHVIIRDIPTVRRHPSGEAVPATHQQCSRYQGLYEYLHDRCIFPSKCRVD